MAKKTKTATRPRGADFDREARELHMAMVELVRVYQLRDRKRVCYYDVSVTQCYALGALLAGGPLTRLDQAAPDNAGRDTDRVGQWRGLGINHCHMPPLRRQLGRRGQPWQAAANHQHVRTQPWTQWLGGFLGQVDHISSQSVT